MGPLGAAGTAGGGVGSASGSGSGCGSGTIAGSARRSGSGAATTASAGGAAASAQADKSGYSDAMNRRLSGLAVASASRHCDGCSDDADSTGAATARLSAANTITKGSGRWGPATERAAAARNCGSIRAACARTSSSALWADGEERSFERASNSTNWRQRTARSCGLAAGCANTVSRRSSNRTAYIRFLQDRSMHRSRGAQS